MGTAMITRSSTMLIAAWAQAKTWKFMHLPLCSPSQLVQMYVIGVQLTSRGTVSRWKIGK
jgi:hypothetical protein